MKIVGPFLLSAIVLIATSCGSNIKFPVSAVTPAAEIKGSKKKDKHNNYVIKLTAEHMASADRLTPPRANYSVWVVTESNGTKNLGKLNVRNGKKTSFESSIPFAVTEIFITAEDQGDHSYPSGVEIARAKF